MYTWQIRSQILNLGQNISYIQIKMSSLKSDNRKDPSAHPGHPRPNDSRVSLLTTVMLVAVKECIMSVVLPQSV